MLNNLNIYKSPGPDVEKRQYYSGEQESRNMNLRENYRQISLTCILCKIAEKVARSRVADFWADLNLFNPDHFAYLSGKSTLLQ